MNHNYNIKLNPKQPTSEDIARYQDFDALLSQFEETAPVVPLNKPRSAIIRRLVYVGSAAAAVLVGLLFFIGNNSDKKAEAQYRIAQEEYFNKQPFINPPIPAAKAQFASQKVNANKGGIYKFGNGSRLVIPAETFQNDRGEMVQGDVDIRIKEYHDFVDLFLSGIPMTYDSAGTVYNLESAGMIEIYAEQNGQRVKIASGKSIDVELVSSIVIPDINVPPHYNIYKLDVDNKKWVYQDIDNIQIMNDDFSDLKEDDPLYEAKKTYAEELANISALQAQELKRIETSLPKPPMPARPQTRNGDMPSLELDFLDDLNGNADGDSEVIRQQYDGKVWQLSPSSPAFNENAAKVTWEDFKLKQLNDRDFELTLIAGSNELKLIINPVLSGTEYDEAMATYDDKKAEYDKLLEEREVALQAKKDLLNKRLAEQKAIAKSTFENQIEQYETKNNSNNNNLVKRKIVNRFKASSFGIWNCDRPIPPEIYQLDATFVSKDGKEFNHHTAFLVDKHRNTVARFYATKGAKLRFNANSDNLLWLVTNDNKIAVFRPEDFKRINRKKGSYTFNLEVIDEQIDDEKEVRKILSF